MQKIFLAAAASLALAASAAAQETPIPTLDQSGNYVCNEAGSFVQVPGQPDMFVGRVMAIGTQAYCNAGNFTTSPTVGLFQLFWYGGNASLVLKRFILTMPTTINSTYVRSIYDPTLMSFGGDIWMAAECTPHTPDGVEHVSACVAPLLPDLSGIDTSRFSVPVLGDTWPDPYAGNKNQSINSASIPQIINWGGSTFLYWTNDHHDKMASQPIITRGAELYQDTAGRFWVLESSGTPISATDSNLSTVVYDVAFDDSLYDHVASVRTLYPSASGNGFYAISTLGGSSFGALCSNAAQPVPGCWRAGVTFSTAPLGYNVFAANPLPTDQIPVNPQTYPKPIINSAGQKYWLAGFLKPMTSWNGGYAPAIPVKNQAIIPWPSDIP